MEKRRPALSNLIPWIKANLLIVISVVVMLLGIATLFWPTMSHGSAFSERLQERAEKQRAIERLSGASVELPPAAPGEEPRRFNNVIINQASVTRLENLLSERQQAFGNLLHAAVRFNRDGPNGGNPHEPMYNAVFPEPPQANTASHIARAKVAYREALLRLHDRLGAGQPPTAEQIERRREDRGDRARSQSTSDSAIDPVARVAIGNRAAEIRLYAAPPRFDEAQPTGAFDIDPWVAATTPPTLTELWNGQMELWIQQDLVTAINRVNDADSVLENPIKRILSIAVQDYIGTAAGSGVPDDPLPRDYQISFTGRTTTSLYDVRPVVMSVIVDSRRIPQLLNALTAVNFMTPEIVRVQQVDEAEHFAQGYAYGEADVVQLDLWVETLWLRPWTAGHESEAEAEQLDERYNPGLMPDEARFERGMAPRDEELDTSNLQRGQSYGEQSRRGTTTGGRGRGGGYDGGGYGGPSRGQGSYRGERE